MTDAIASLEAARERALREAASIDDDLSRLRQLHGDMRDMVPLHEEFRGLRHRSWLVPGLFHSVGIGILASEPFCGKTHLLTYLACCIATGRELWEGFAPIQPRPVLYLYGESDRQGFLWAFRKAYEALGLTNPPIYCKPRGYRNAQVRIGTPGLESAIKATGAGLVIFDTLNKFSRAKENDNNDLEEKFLEPATELSEETGAYFLFVHHEQKAAADAKKIYRIRGGSSMSGGVDALLMLERDADDDDSTLRTLHLEKVRGCPRRKLELDFDFQRKIVRKT